VYEQDQKVVVQADLPGLRKEDVKAQIENLIILSDEREHEAQWNEGGAYLSGRSYGRCYRVIPLPQRADSASAPGRFRSRMEEVHRARPPRRRTNNKMAARALSNRAARPAFEMEAAAKCGRFIIFNTALSATAHASDSPTVLNAPLEVSLPPTTKTWRLSRVRFFGSMHTAHFAS
jgi:Hsp20/alpha crystallin family